MSVYLSWAMSNAFQVSILATYFTYNVLKTRSELRRQGHFDCQVASNQLWRLRLLCVTVSAFFALHIQSTSRDPVVLNAEGAAEGVGSWWPLILFWTAIREVHEMLGACLRGLSLWWNLGIGGVVALVMDLPEGLVVQQVVSIIRVMVLKVVSGSFVQRFWFLLVPLSLALAVSTAALIGSVLSKFVPTLMGNIYRIINSDRRYVRGTVLSLLSLALVYDAVLASRLDHPRTALTFLTVAMESGLFAAQDLEIANNVIRFSLSNGLVFAGLIAYLSGQWMTGSAFYLGFWAAARESQLVPRAPGTLPPQWGVTMIPFAAEGYLQSTGEGIRTLYFALIGVCMLAMFGPQTFTDRVEEMVVASLEKGVLKLLKWVGKVLFNQLFPLFGRYLRMLHEGVWTPCVRAVRSISRRATVILSRSAKWTIKYLLKPVLVSLRAVGIAFRDRMLYVWKMTRRVMNWVEENVLDRVGLAARNVWSFTLDIARWSKEHIVLELIMELRAIVSRLVIIVLSITRWAKTNVLDNLLRVVKAMWKALRDWANWVTAIIVQPIMRAMMRVMRAVVDVILLVYDLVGPILATAHEWVTRTWCDWISPLGLPLILQAASLFISSQISYPELHPQTGAAEFEGYGWLEGDWFQAARILFLTAMAASLQYIGMNVYQWSPDRGVNQAQLEQERPETRQRTMFSEVVRRFKKVNFGLMRDYVFTTVGVAANSLAWAMFNYQAITARAFYGAMILYKQTTASDLLLATTVLGDRICLLSLMTFCQSSRILQRHNGVRDLILSGLDILYIAFGAGSVIGASAWSWFYADEESLVSKGFKSPDSILGYSGFRAWVLIQTALSIARYHFRRLKDRPSTQPYVAYVQSHWIGIFGLSCTTTGTIHAVSALNVDIPSTSGIVMVRLGSSAIMVAFGMNCIGMQWPRLAKLRRGWFVVDFMARRAFRLSQPAVAFKLALPLWYELMKGGGGTLWLGTLIISAYSSICMTVWMFGDALEWRKLSEFGRNLFDLVGSSATHMGNLALHTSRAIGGMMRRLGQQLLIFSSSIWRSLIVPFLRSMSGWVRYIWTHALVSWVASLVLLIGLIKWNQSGGDELLIEMLRESPSALRSLISSTATWAWTPLGKVTLLSGGLTYMYEQTAGWVEDGQLFSSPEVPEWILALTEGSLLLSPFVLLPLAISAIIASVLKLHRTQRRPLMESRRIIFVPILSTMACLSIAPSLTRPIFGMTITWAILAFAVTVFDDRQRQETEATLRRVHEDRAAWRPRRTHGHEQALQGDEYVEWLLNQLSEADSRQSTVYAAEECIICMEPMSGESDRATTKSAILLCGHQFHRVCLAGWLKEQRRCPLCREPVTRGGQIFHSLF